MVWQVYAQFKKEDSNPKQYFSCSKTRTNYVF